MMRPSVRGIEWGRAIGRGARAQVFVARRRRQAVAVKVVPLPGRSARDSFERELLRGLVPVHGSLVQVLDGGIADGCGFVVMQWVDGLDAELVAGLLRLHGRLLDPLLAVFVVVQVLRGLEYLHRLDGRGEAHGGVRANHVLLSIGGEVKLTGYGRDPSASRADDLLEVGLLLHELLTGERTRTPEPGRRLALPRALDELRLRLLATHACDRPTASETLAALESWSGHADRTTMLARLMQSLTGVDRPRTIEPFDLPAPRRWQRVIAAAGAALAIAAGVLAWW